MTALVSSGGLVAGTMPAAAAPESCVAAVRAFTCAPLPVDPDQRRSTLAAWDAEARAAVAEHRLRDASGLFGCLLLEDPRPEHASNLSVALKQSGDLASALSAATCAEQLNAENSEAQARARARREAIERLLAALIPAADPARSPPVPVDSPHAREQQTAERSPIAAPAVTLPALPAAGVSQRDRPRTEDVAPAVASQPESAPARRRRPLVHVTTVALAGALLIGATAAYLVARHDASRFDEEQTTNGFTARAQALRASAQTWQGASIGGFAGAGVAGLVAAITW